MDAPHQTRIERRSAQRFDGYQVAVALQTLDGRKGSGFTLDLSSRGALLWTDFPLRPAELLDMTLVMPSEITLSDQMSVRCRARVLRLQGDGDGGKLAVAVKIEHYDFLPRELTPLQQHAISHAPASRA
jgi:PilZ domain